MKEYRCGLARWWKLNDLTITQLAEERKRGMASTIRLEIWSKLEQWKSCWCWQQWWFVWWHLCCHSPPQPDANVVDVDKNLDMDDGIDLSNESRQLSLFLIQLVLPFLHFLPFFRLIHVFWSHFECFKASTGLPELSLSIDRLSLKC